MILHSDSDKENDSFRNSSTKDGECNESSTRNVTESESELGDESTPAKAKQLYDTRQKKRIVAFAREHTQNLHPGWNLNCHMAGTG